jgi:hypothetical protein
MAGIEKLSCIEIDASADSLTRTTYLYVKSLLTNDYKEKDFIYLPKQNIMLIRKIYILKILDIRFI